MLPLVLVLLFVLLVKSSLVWKDQQVKDDKTKAVKIGWEIQIGNMV